MAAGAAVLLSIAVTALACLLSGCSGKPGDAGQPEVRAIVASDSILSEIIASLLPPGRYRVDAILPPGQCPGHYDVRPTDIEKMKKAVLIVSFRGIRFMSKTGSDDARQLVIDPEDRNWMAPGSYVQGLELLAARLSERFPEDRDEIARRKEHAIRLAKEGADRLLRKITGAGLFGKPVVASSMQKEPLEWMGFKVVAEYGRQEAMSARDVVRVAEVGKDRKAIMVVDNLQSGPDAGKGIAETLKVPHVVLTNFPSERGYLATLGENVDVLLKALGRRDGMARK
jgi:ABC-type Zn uptake system ZnuABC Zn-binding protein ZnuA